MFKAEKGITLIALVVTIIILLILAGVTLSLSLNGNGLLQKSRESGKAYENAQTNEETLMKETENEISNYLGK